MISRLQTPVGDDLYPVMAVQPAASQFSSVRFALALAVCLAGYVILVATRTLVFGWSTGRWNFYYVQGFHPAPLLVGCLMAAIAAGCDLWIPPRMAMAFWFAAGLAGELVLHSFMFDRSLTDMITGMGFYNIAMSLSMHDILGRFLELHTNWPARHPVTNMPGMLMLFKAIEVFTIRPLAIALIMAVISNLGAIFLYLIAESVYASRELALRSAVLYLFIPSHIYFLPTLNTLSPVPILFALLMLVRFLHSGNRLIGLLAGVALYVSVLFDPETLALGLFFAAAITRSVRVDKTPVSRLGWMAILGTGGFLAMYLLLRIVYGFDWFAAMHALLNTQIDFNVDHARPYSSWLFGNPYEFFLAAGLLVSICCFAYLTIVLVKSDVPISFAQGSFLAGLFATLAILIVSGVMRGEVSRLWIFLMPFVQVVGADFCGRFRPYVYRVVLGGAIIQTAISTAMVGWVG